MEKIENKYGYGRISAKDQNEARQVQAFLEYGINEENIFIDKKSGKDFPPLFLLFFFHKKC